MENSLQNFEELKNRILEIVSKHEEVPAELIKLLNDTYMDVYSVATEGRGIQISYNGNKAIEEKISDEQEKANQYIREKYKAKCKLEYEYVKFILEKREREIDKEREENQEDMDNPKKEKIKEQLTSYYINNGEMSKNIADGIIEDLYQRLFNIRNKIITEIAKRGEKDAKIKKVDSNIIEYIIGIKNKTTIKKSILEAIKKDDEGLARYISEIYEEYGQVINKENETEIKTSHQKFVDKIREYNFLPDNQVKNKTSNLANKEIEERKLEGLSDDILK